MLSKRSIFFLLTVILIGAVVVFFLLKKDPGPVTSNVDLSGTNEHDFTLDSASTEEKKLVKIAIPVGAAEYRKLLELSLQFQTLHQDINVQIDTIDKADAYQYYKTASQLGDAPDIMLLNNEWIHEFAALGYLSELDEVLMSNIQDLQIEPMIRQVKWNGFMWAVPKEIDPYMLAWNKAQLQQHELSAPPADMEQLLDFMAAAHRPSDSEYGLYFDFNDPRAFISLIWLLGEPWSDNETGQADWDEEQIVHKLERFLLPAFQSTQIEEEEEQESDTVNEQLSIEEQSIMQNFPLIDEQFDPWELMNENKVALLLTKLSDFREHASTEIELTALPLHMDSVNSEERYGGWLQGKSYVVSSKSANREQAFAWIQAVNTTEAQIQLMYAGGGMPVMINAYADRLKSLRHIEHIAAAIEQGRVLPNDPELAYKLKELQTGLELLWKEELTITEWVEYIHLNWNKQVKPDLDTDPGSSGEDDTPPGEEDTSADKDAAD